MSGHEKLRVFSLSPSLEEEFRGNAQYWDGVGNRPPIEIDLELSFRTSVRRMFTPAIERGNVPVVVLCSDDVRSMIGEFFLRHFSPYLPVNVISYAELGTFHNIESVGVISADG